MRRSLPPLILVLASLGAAACATTPGVRFAAIYLDLDGTALNSKAEVPARTAEALERYRACGGHVGLASGRTYEQLERYVPDLRPDLPVVVFNGAASVSPDGKDVLFVQRLPEGVVRNTLAACKNLPGVIGVVIHEMTVTTIDRSTEELAKILREANITPTGTIAPEAGPPLTAVKLLVLAQPDSSESVAAAVSAAVGPAARVIVSGPKSIEVVAPGVDKALPVKAALERAGIDPADALLFGDSGNDVALVSSMGPGFAMANCRKETCEAALAIIKGNDTDAVANVIEKIAILPTCRAGR
jgi:Cof subfamily protein (haloacid dehalogenase superfamily)